jgi:hypothetical protein
MIFLQAIRNVFVHTPQDYPKHSKQHSIGNHRHIFDYNPNAIKK